MPGLIRWLCWTDWQGGFASFTSRTDSGAVRARRWARARHLCWLSGRRRSPWDCAWLSRVRGWIPPDWGRSGAASTFSGHRTERFWGGAGSFPGWRLILPLWCLKGAWRFWSPVYPATVVPAGGLAILVACLPCRCGSRRGACLLCRPPTLPLTCFPAPYPPSPLPRWGRGRFFVILCKGLRPLHPRG